MLGGNKSGGLTKLFLRDPVEYLTLHFFITAPLRHGILPFTGQLEPKMFRLHINKQQKDQSKRPSGPRTNWDKLTTHRAPRS